MIKLLKHWDFVIEVWERIFAQELFTSNKINAFAKGHRSKT